MLRSALLLAVRPPVVEKEPQKPRCTEANRRRLPAPALTIFCLPFMTQLCIHPVFHIYGFQSLRSLVTHAKRQTPAE